MTEVFRSRPVLSPDGLLLLLLLIQSVPPPGSASSSQSASCMQPCWS
ncbi:MAG: hypothetical protein ACRYG2_06905 [Janthinobacterium lividum]